MSTDMAMYDSSIYKHNTDGPLTHLVEPQVRRLDLVHAKKNNGMKQLICSTDINQNNVSIIDAVHSSQYV